MSVRIVSVAKLDIFIFVNRGHLYPKRFKPRFLTRHVVRAKHQLNAIVGRAIYVKAEFVKSYRTTSCFNLGPYFIEFSEYS